MTDEIKAIPGSPIWLAKTIERLNNGCPLYRGKFFDPFRHPDKPGNKTLFEWLKTDAPEDLKHYCRDSLRFYRENKKIIPEWCEKLERGLR